MLYLYASEFLGYTTHNGYSVLCDPISFTSLIVNWARKWADNNLLVQG